ncbi:MAG: S-layer homology domain-containing protein [Syntrophomonas sp.]
MPGEVKEFRKNRGLLSILTLLTILLIMLFPAMAYADDDHLGQWTQRNVGAYFNGICYRGGQFVAVGNGGAIFTSTNGTDWVQQNSGTANNLNAICYNWSTFVAVGDDGTVLTSPNGTAWTQRNSRVKGWKLNAVCYGLGKFVAVGDSGMVITSASGTEWGWKVTSDQKNLYGICHNGSRFIAVGASCQILTSSDAVNWTNRSFNNYKPLQAIRCISGRTMAAGFHVIIFSSGDTGANWKWDPKLTTFPYDVTGICYEGGNLIIVTSGGEIFTSKDDGSSWTLRTNVGSALNGISYNGKTYVAVGSTIVQNDATPTDICLTNDHVAEKVPAGTVVGTLNSVDSDTGETFTYSLVNGPGDTDNGSFAINGDKLSIKVVPDYAIKNNYSIRVKTTDYHGLSFEKVVNIYIDNISELQSITTPAPITGVANGTAKTAEALGLPPTVALATDNGSVSASVYWAVYACPYDISSLAAQTFDISGAVTLPTEVVNPNNVSLTTSINVTVDAAGTGNQSDIRVSVLPKTVTLTRAGAKQQLTATVVGTAAVTRTVAWASDNPAAATVDNAGLVTAVARGTAVITAASTEDNTKADTSVITVAISASSDDSLENFSSANSSLVRSTGSGNITNISAYELNKASGLTVQGSGANLIISKDALAAMNIKSSLEVMIKPVKTEELSEAARVIVGTRPVFNIKVIADGKEVTNTGKLTIEIPYTPQRGEDTGQLAAFYIDDNGAITLMEDSHYDPVKKAIVFTSPHLSVYAIGVKPDGSVKDNPVQSAKDNPDSAARNFTDVASGHWAEKAIYDLAGRGIVSGKTATTFAPDDKITRAEFVTMVGKMSGQPLPAGSSPFSDVTADAWHAPYVSWAVQIGVVQGYNGQFHPHDLISRQDMAVMLVNYAEKTGKYTFPKNRECLAFADDAAIAGYAKKAVYALQQAGIITGQGGSNFAPTAGATRAEAAQVISVLLKNINQ